MAADLLSQWQGFATLLGQASHASVASFVDSAERFTASARKYLEDSAGATAPAAAEAARAFGDALRDQSIAFFKLPWSASADFGTGMRTSLPEVPALGLTREHQLRWQRTADAAQRAADAQRRLQCLWTDVLRDAAIAFVARLDAAGRGAAIAGAGALRRLYDAWIECAEEAYARTAHSDSFCSALADFVNANNQWRREFAASIEHCSQLFDLPTRSEVNSLTLRLKSLEQQLPQERDARTARNAPSAPRNAPSARRNAPSKPRGVPRASRPRRAKHRPKP